MNGSEGLIGDLAEGALVARAAEPAHGKAADGHSHETACLNCGTGLVGTHCHQCGQAAHVHKTLGAFFHDLLHGVFHFEGKVWRTLPLLAWNPGKLTREYIDGRRASYVSPIALFLFVVFVTFAAVRMASGEVQLAPGIAKTRQEAQQATAAAVAKLESDRAAAVKAGKDTGTIDADLADARAARDLAAQGRLPVVKATAQNASSRKTVEMLNAAWEKARQNPDLTLYKLQSNAYKYSWLLIPLSVPFVWLLFPFSRRFALYDHTVFITYSLSFMLLLLTGLSLLSDWNPWGAAGGLGMVLLLYAPFHMFRHLRATYSLSGFGAAWRTTVLAIAATFVVAIWGIAMIGLLL